MYCFKIIYLVIVDVAQDVYCSSNGSIGMELGSRLVFLYILIYNNIFHDYFVNLKSRTTNEESQKKDFSNKSLI